MIPNNVPIVFSIVLLMGVQVNFFFNSVFDKSANRVMTVEAPVSRGFAVYDAKGKVVNFSKASNHHSL